jgi:hypothetical protein
VIQSTAYLKVGPDGLTKVDASLYLSGGSFIRCCTYADRPPILALDDRCVSVSIAVPDRHQVTGDDLDTARRLADAVAAYIADLKRHQAKQEGATDRAA